MNLSFAWRVQFSQLSTINSQPFSPSIHPPGPTLGAEREYLNLSFASLDRIMNYVRTRLASTRFSAFYFVVSPLPCFLRPFACHAEGFSEKAPSRARRGLSDLGRGCPARSIRRGEPLTSDFEDATLLSRSYRVGSVSVPGQPRWPNLICGEQDDPLPTLP